MERWLEAPRVLFRIAGLPITETVVNAWAIMAFLLIAGLVLARSLTLNPGKRQVWAELLVNGLRGLVESAMGRDKVGFTPYMGALALFIFFANISGLLGVRPPTSDLNVTLGLALLTFVLIQFYGFKSRGLGYLKGFAEPIFLFAPMNLMGELARPVSLAVRLFGNVLGGSIIMALIYSILPVALPVPFHLYFDLFIGLLQTFIFVMLTMVFVALAMD